jgi:hypothetical protein
MQPDVANPHLRGGPFRRTTSHSSGGTRHAARQHRRPPRVRRVCEHPALFRRRSRGHRSTRSHGCLDPLRNALVRRGRLQAYPHEAPERRGPCRFSGRARVPWRSEPVAWRAGAPGSCHLAAQALLGEDSEVGRGRSPALPDPPRTSRARRGRPTAPGWPDPRPAALPRLSGKNLAQGIGRPAGRSPTENKTAESEHPGPLRAGISPNRSPMENDSRESAHSRQASQSHTRRLFATGDISRACPPSWSNQPRQLAGAA